jgi:hypothetical protein
LVEDDITVASTKQCAAAYKAQTAGSLLEGEPDSVSGVSTTVLLENESTRGVRDK